MWCFCAGPVGEAIVAFIIGQISNLTVATGYSAVWPWVGMLAVWLDVFWWCECWTNCGLVKYKHWSKRCQSINMKWKSLNVQSEWYAAASEREKLSCFSLYIMKSCQGSLCCIRDMHSVLAQSLMIIKFHDLSITLLDTCKVILISLPSPFSDLPPFSLPCLLDFPLPKSRWKKTLIS